MIAYTLLRQPQFLRPILRKAEWLSKNREELTEAVSL